jgi:hypothetical protein
VSLPRRFVCHSCPQVQALARECGWKLGVRYTELRNVRASGRIDFLDIDWQRYDFHRHVEAARELRPFLTVARDITRKTQLKRVIDEAYLLLTYSTRVAVVPKAMSIGPHLRRLIPHDFLLGYSVPTSHGGTRIDPRRFHGSVHLLGGRPDVQRQLATLMSVTSLDCNRFTLDARFGDYFDGKTFRPHPRGGYAACIAASLANINRLWAGYSASPP